MSSTDSALGRGAGLSDDARRELSGLPPEHIARAQIEAKLRPAGLAAEEDHTLPEGRWAFDAGVTAVFDNMLRRSIPQYEVMRDAVFTLGSSYVQPNTAIVDLGCSRGEALDPFLRRFGVHNRYVGIDVSEPMLAEARQRFSGYIETSIVDIRRQDLRQAYPAERASLTLCVLTLQFTPIEYRQRILRRAWQHTAAGGALILVEKVLGGSAELDERMVSRYYALKAANGYSQEEIERKRLSLEGVLVPLTARMNEEMLAGAGFREVDCFWRWMNFAGWVAVKE